MPLTLADLADIASNPPQGVTLDEWLSLPVFVTIDGGYSIQPLNGVNEVMQPVELPQLPDSPLLETDEQLEELLEQAEQKEPVIVFHIADSAPPNEEESEQQYNEEDRLFIPRTDFSVN